MNNGTGPVNLECWHLRHKMFNLIDMCGYDRATEKEITNMLLDSKDRYKQIAEKTICRWLVYNDDTLYLMPYCLDRLRSFANLRKIWRRALDKINVRAQAIENK